jgi:hypothetical protein
MDLEYLYCLMRDIGPRKLVDVHFFAADASTSTTSSLDITLAHSSSNSISDGDGYGDVDVYDDDDDDEIDVHGNDSRQKNIHQQYASDNAERHRKRRSALNSTQANGSSISKKQKPKSGFLDKIKALFQ